MVDRQKEDVRTAFITSSTAKKIMIDRLIVRQEKVREGKRKKDVSSGFSHYSTAKKIRSEKQEEEVLPR